MELCGVIEGFYGRPWSMQQRLALFKDMAAWGMNVYMYAPKDDLKLRASWRELYDDAEVANLLTLIKRCQQHKIHFVYTIAPGLDIRYADEAELQALTVKIQQVLDLGVAHVCIIFDDIPFQLQQADQEAFNSFAEAQAFIANALFQFVRARKQGFFFFCPTEYCGRMARPGVASSGYLRTLGEQLHEGIDIFWTGPEIVSETIPLETILELQTVLKRKPLIWDNLHANDYDIRRIYFGPYSGRSSTLKKEIRGILSNPNNEFEANFIPLRTLASYAQQEDYHAREAYQSALREWLPRLTTQGDAITVAELELLGDLCYVFFEHGERAKALLDKAKRLLVVDPPDWEDDFAELQATASSVQQLFKKLTELDNRELLYSVYAYIWEVAHAIRYLVDFVSHQKQGKAGSFGRPEQLPNTYRGGVVADIEQLLPLDQHGKVKHMQR